MVTKVAHRLGPLREEVVFVGGATTELLLTRPVIYDVRITKDVDVIVGVINRNDYYRFAERLRERGFLEASEPGNPICRWKVDDLLVDVMPTEESILGFSNRWYPEAIRNAMEYPLEDDLPIRLVAPLFFLTTKFEAFRGRGNNDLYTSHDIEDILTLLDGRPEIIDEFEACSHDLRTALAGYFSQLKSHPDFEYVIAGQFPSDAVGRARSSELIQLIEVISRGTI